MDQVKIGKFIAGCRKNVHLTQMQLAEKLNITDRAVSKWETGRAMPDSSIMLALCNVLQITVNDLLSGEVVSMDNYNKEMENNLSDRIAKVIDEKLEGMDEVVVELIRCKTDNETLRQKIIDLNKEIYQLKNDVNSYKSIGMGLYVKQNKHVWE